ncbi:MAG: site-2 protease family protein [Candidatus Micrarchaeota archaeon]|nr:site-2 protease family protein [Candidatus Micrarchaeota archaeon]
MKDKTKLAFVLLAVALSVALFLEIVESQLPAFAKAVAAAVVLALCGVIISKAYSLESFWGIFLLRSRQGLALLDRLSQKYRGLWQHFAEIGMVVAYGSFAYFLMPKKKIEWKSTIATYSIGTFFLVFLSSLLPVAMLFLLSMLRGGEEFASAGVRFQQEAKESGILPFLSFVFLVLGGIALSTTMSIIAYGLMVAGAVLSALLGDHQVLASTPPGGVPLIPGINLDLVLGVSALAVVLAAHEASHGILARLYRIPVKSSGLAFFGFIPIGAFVDIDEKKLFSENKIRQNSVLVAGTAANFATAIVFFFALLLFSFFFLAAPSAATRQIASFFALTFSLNMIVAAVNLVPLPLFDGYHLMRNAVPHPLAQRLISYTVAFSFLLTLSPWLLR